MGPRIEIDFSSLPMFGQQGFEFIYSSSTVANNKQLPRSEFLHFVAMESGTRVIRVFLSTRGTIGIVHRANVHPISDEKRPYVN